MTTSPEPPDDEEDPWVFGDLEAGADGSVPPPGDIPADIPADSDVDVE